MSGSSLPYASQVYFARCGAYVKIGFSSFPSKRIQSIGPASPLIRPDDIDWSAKVELLRVIPDCIMKDELALQQQFAPFHAVGEWFHATEDCLRQIAALEGYVTIHQQRLQRSRARRTAAKAKAVTP
jgi:hypothetical protein